MRSYRNNAVKDGYFLTAQLRSLHSSGDGIPVSNPVTGELSGVQFGTMIAYKLYLRQHHTRNLAQLVHHKVQDSPLPIVEFLRINVQ